MAALFNKKEETKNEEVTVTTPEISAAARVSGEDIMRVLKHPRITEKSTYGTADNIYVFDVALDANKKQIKEAIQAAYKVTPVKVHVSKVPTKTVRNQRTGKIGTTTRGKKAYVYLKKGETISVM